jgi:hypothetical protein
MALTRDDVAERFDNDVAKHQIQILRDEGLYRHVRFRQPDTYCMGFDLITWPGYLCYTGDMGTFVFSRIADMFEFFRQPDSSEPRINPGYWSEKVQAQDRGGITEFSEEKLKARVKERFEEWVEEEGIDDLGSLWNAIEREVFGLLDSYGAEGKNQAYQAIMSVEHNGRYPFQDFWEVSADVYTYQFLWCCHALVWGIRRYDEERPEIGG